MNAAARITFVFLLVVVLILGSSAAVHHPTPDFLLVLVGLGVSCYVAFMAMWLTHKDGPR